jgi:hypothetical protein
MWTMRHTSHRRKQRRSFLSSMHHGRCTTSPPCSYPSMSPNRRSISRTSPENSSPENSVSTLLPFPCNFVLKLYIRKSLFADKDLKSLSLDIMSSLLSDQTQRFLQAFLDAGPSEFIHSLVVTLASAGQSNVWVGSPCWRAAEFVELLGMLSTGHAFDVVKER